MSYPVLARRDTALDDAETVALLRDRLGEHVVGEVAEYGELTVEISPEGWHAAGAACRDEERLAFDFFDCLFGVDAGEDGLDVVAVLYSTSKGRRIMLRARCDGGRDDPSLPTLTDLYPGANWHEREAFDMFGIDFVDHPGLLPRILCVENFEGWPLRKEFPLASRVAKPWPGVKDPAEPDEDGNVVVREPAIGEAPGPSGLDEIIARQAREANPTASDEVEADQGDAGGADAANAASEEPVREEVQLDQELYDQLIADGKSERIARSKAKASFIKKQRAAEREAAAADAPQDDAPPSPDGEVGGATEGETVEEAAPRPSVPDDDGGDAGEDTDATDAVDEDAAATAAATAEATRAEQAAAREARAAEQADEPAADGADDVEPIPSSPPPDVDDDAEEEEEEEEVGEEREDDLDADDVDHPDEPAVDEGRGESDVDGASEPADDPHVDGGPDADEPTSEDEADLDDDGPEVPEPGPFGAGSAHPRADGSGPEGWDVKATTDGNVYHTPDSPSWRQAEADVWFDDAATAEAAGFVHWDPYERDDLDGPTTDVDGDGEAEVVTGSTWAEEDDVAAPTGPGGSTATHDIDGDDQVGRVARASFGGDHESVHDGPYGPGSAIPAAGGAGPDGWSVKATSTGNLFHDPSSPDYDDVMADAWFVDEATARAAGFAHWNPELREDLSYDDVGEGVVATDVTLAGHDASDEDGDGDGGDDPGPVGGTLQRDGGPANPDRTGAEPRGFGALDVHEREPIADLPDPDASDDGAGGDQDATDDEPSVDDEATSEGDEA